MPLLTRYLLRAQIGPLVFAFVALTGVVLLNTLARSLAELAGKGLPARVFVEFFLLSLPANVALTLPMSVLVAVLYSFSGMAAENEITALRASGVDLRRLLMPLLLAAGLIAGGMVWFNDSVLPAANHRWRMLMADVARTSPLLFVQPQVVTEIESVDDGTRVYLRAADVDQASNLMRGVTIYDVSVPARSRTIYADSARMQVSADGTDMVLVLHDGHVRELDRGEAASFRRIDFEQQRLLLPGVRQTLDRSAVDASRTDRDMPGPMIRARLDTLRAELASLEAQVAATTADAAGAAGVALRGTGPAARLDPLRFHIRELEVEVQKKLAIAAATLVFVLLGVPLALRFPRGGVGMVIAASLTIFSIYYVGLIGGEALANAGIVPPMIAMWSTNVLFGTLGLVGFWRLGDERSNARGGDSGGLRRVARRLARGRIAVRPVEAR